MLCTVYYRTLCVTAVLISLSTGPVTAVSIWSRLRNLINLDGQLQKRDISESLKDEHHGVKMGVPSTSCDDGEHGIEIDWDVNDKSLTTCYQKEKRDLKVNSEPITITEEELPSKHVCLDEKIEYGRDLPLNGKHRPLWPKFGEYEYLPPQRWVHSLEHGAVVLLYHPCSNSRDLDKLKKALKACLTKYIISPYKQIPNDMPFALLAFRHARLISNTKDLSQVYEFIKTFGLLGPETHVTKDGQYHFRLKAGVAHITNTNMCTD